MSNKYYNLTEQANKGVKDKAPDWMEPLFQKKEAEVKENPFKDSTNYLISNTNDVKKCETCGTPLKANEVDFCENCL